MSSTNKMNVESVNYSTGDLSPVPGSPFTSTAAPLGEFTRAFQIDPSGKFVYAVNLGEATDNPKYISVFSLSQTTGVLTQIQAFDMTPGTDATGLVVDQSLVFVTN
jgi:6-phosphogluconolactonase (cycloisomerase 2 family)